MALAKYSLSPSQLMYGIRITTMPNDNHFDVLSTYASLTKKRKHHYRLLENFYQAVEERILDWIEGDSFLTSERS